MGVSGVCCWEPKPKYVFIRIQGPYVVQLYFKGPLSKKMLRIDKPRLFRYLKYYSNLQCLIAPTNLRQKEKLKSTVYIIYFVMITCISAGFGHKLSLNFNISLSWVPKNITHFKIGLKWPENNHNTSFLPKYSLDQGVLSVPGIAGYKWVPARIGRFGYKNY